MRVGGGAACSESREISPTPSPVRFTGIADRYAAYRGPIVSIAHILSHRFDEQDTASTSLCALRISAPPRTMGPLSESREIPNGVLFSAGEAVKYTTGCADDVSLRHRSLVRGRRRLETAFSTSAPLTPRRSKYLPPFGYSPIPNKGPS